MEKLTQYSLVPSPLGDLLATSDGMFLIGLHIVDSRRGRTPLPEWRRADEPFREVRRQLEDYFAGRLRNFDLPLKMEGTPFQKRVWRELVRIPFAATISYAELARRVGQPGAARAVGAANGRNPIGIIVPCHRVIGADGSLTGYGGGLPNKRWLLEHERMACLGLAEPAAAVATDA
ncbi:MAG: methylated-DNA--[protein]-cysteine S-methyltransferase [Planctomycetia bacterium]|nr:methylated-DNA--[protein]-cysteine S-methyltransferase [Planctomycetia bacterium]